MDKMSNSVPSSTGDEAKALFDSLGLDGPLEEELIFFWSPNSDEMWAVAKVAYALDSPDGYALWNMLEAEEQAVCFRLRQQFDKGELPSCSITEQETIGRLATKLILIRDEVIS